MQNDFIKELINGKLSSLSLGKVMRLFHMHKQISVLHCIDRGIVFRLRKVVIYSNLHF